MIGHLLRMPENRDPIHQKCMVGSKTQLTLYEGQDIIGTGQWTKILREGGLEVADAIVLCQALVEWRRLVREFSSDGSSGQGWWWLIVNSLILGQWR